MKNKRGSKIKRNEWEKKNNTKANKKNEEEQWRQEKTILTAIQSHQKKKGEMENK